MTDDDQTPCPGCGFQAVNLNRYVFEVATNSRWHVECFIRRHPGLFDKLNDVGGTELESGIG